MIHASLPQIEVQDSTADFEQIFDNILAGRSVSDWRPVSRHLHGELLSLVENDLGEQAMAFVAVVGPVVALLVTQEMKLVHELH
jgi:hypothetical protein